MPDAMERTVESLETFELPTMPAATDGQILTYLRHSYQMGAIATAAERQALIENLCQRFELTLSDEELQAGGNEFRLQHNLLSTTATLNWLEEQRLTPEDWTQGIRANLLEAKLKDYLFGSRVDMHYINNRKEFRRVAFSQILVPELTEALTVVEALRADPASFCALALDYAQGRQSREQGGFAGIHFLPKLMPEIAQAIADASAGEIVGPISTRFGHHVIKLEKWFPIELNPGVRAEILDALFQNWLQEPQAR